MPLTEALPTRVVAFYAARDRPRSPQVEAGSTVEAALRRRLGGRSHDGDADFLLGTAGAGAPVRAAAPADAVVRLALEAT